MKFSRSIFTWILVGPVIGAGILVAGCLQIQDSDTPGSAHPVWTPAIARPPSLGVNATLIQPSYLPGEEVEVWIAFMNGGPDPLTIRSFPPTVSLTNPTWGVVYTFSHGNGTILLEPGETINHTLKWDQRDGDGDQVCPGYYSVEVADILVEDDTGAGTRALYSEGTVIAQVLIQYPQGALEKDVPVNQSKTLNGATVELVNITSSYVGAQARVLVQLPHRPSSEPESQSDVPAPSPTPPDANPSAHYRLDDGPAKKFMRVGLQVADDGTVFVWDFESMPADAHDLYIVITRLGTWEGLCEFHVDLSEEVSSR